MRCIDGDGEDPRTSGASWGGGSSLTVPSDCVSFDSAVSRTARISDIRRSLVVEYLNCANSSLADQDISDIDLYRMMRIADGPDDDLRPINAALMMFAPRPEVFFPGSRTEVLLMRDRSGGLAERVCFDGPVFVQIDRALGFVRDRAFVERVRKIPGEILSIRYRSYPIEAIREVIANALYHRSYEIPEPVKICVYPDRIEVTSSPGPEPGISDDDLRNLRMQGKSCRNERLGDLLKGIHLVEGRNRGMTLVAESLRRNGSPPPVCKTDPGRTYLTAIIPIHPDFVRHESMAATSSTRRRSSEDTKAEIIRVLEETGCQSSSSLAKLLGYAGVNPVFRRCLNELLDEREVEYLHPEKPNDCRQKICRRSRRILPDNCRD